MLATTYPGVYIEEVPSGARPIAGVATSVAAFIGYFSRGPLDKAVRLFNRSDFERELGGLRADSEASYALEQFFLNGGTQAWVVRTAAAASTATSTVGLDDDGDVASLTVVAASPGTWGDNLLLDVDHDTTDPATTFNLHVREVVDGQVVQTETFRNLTIDEGPHFVADVVNDGSRLIQVAVATDANRPAVVSDIPLASGGDGSLPGATELKDALAALDHVDLFNLLAIPDTVLLADTDAASVMADATAYCEKRRAFYLLDVPHAAKSRDEVVEIETWIGANATLRHKNAALYFPRPMVADPANGYRLRAVAPSGTAAGLYARTDAARGVWKAPAGVEASLAGVQKLAAPVNDDENGVLNPLAVNCLRSIPPYGNIAWGARTLLGSDQAASEWKYVPVRRMALYLEESLYRGLHWVVFEPNDEPLWSQVRLNVGGFLQTLFRQGAFQGTTPREAYLVKCDRETTTATDVARGVVNVVVGFAPLKPAEFVIIRIQQLAGQNQA